MKRLVPLLLGIGLALPAPLLLVGCENAGDDAETAPDTPELPTTPPGGEGDTAAPKAPTTPPGEPA